MSDYLAFEIQSEIMKRLPVKSLIQFRSVSKSWKALIDSSRFITRYCCQHTQMQRLLVTYEDPVDSEKKYVSFADDDSFPDQKVSYSVSLLANVLKYSALIGSSHGLLCLYGCDALEKDMVVLWNPLIRKAVGVVLPNFPNGMTYGIVVGFGVCQETADPKIVKITHIDSWEDIEGISCIPWQVEVFTLSTGCWRSPYGSNLPRKSIRFGIDTHSVVIDGVLYWLATDRFAVDGGFNYYNLIISFDLTTEEFVEVYLPDRLARVDDYNLSISKRRKSLVVLQCYMNDAGYGVWMMVGGVLDCSFIKIFTVKSADLSVKGFRKNGELLLEIVEHHPGQRDAAWLVAYDLYSKDMNNLQINISAHSVSVYPYIETLLLLDQPEFIIYDEGKATLQSEQLRAKGI